MLRSMVGALHLECDAGELLAVWLSNVWHGLVGGGPRALPGGADEDRQSDAGEDPAHGANAPLTNAEVAEVYEKYGLLIWKRSRAVLRNEEWADDALQDVFVKVMRHGASLRTADSRLAWLYTVTDRCCIDISRHRRRGLVHDAALDDVVLSNSRAAGVGAASQAPCPVEARNFLARLLARLAPMERRLAVLMFGEGCTQTEAARRLGWSRQTTNKKAKLIRQRADELE